MKSLVGLEKFRKDIYSQSGENGILDELLLRLDMEAGFIIEFGANDGYYASNTAHLMETGRWLCVYIEPHEKFEKLKEVSKMYPNMLALNMPVHTKDMPEYVPGTSLDEIISKYCPDVDILSIDIDSYDYHIFRTLEYKPKIVIIEINAHIVPWVEYINQENSYVYGTSFRSMLQLGIEKGYTPVAATGNIFFVRNDLCEGFELPAADEKMFCWDFINLGTRFDENNIMSWTKIDK